jgi:hypothetical protein
VLISGKIASKFFSIVRNQEVTKMKRFVLSVLSLLMACSIFQAQGKETGSGDQALKVEKMVAATSVEQREPVGEKSEFEVSTGKVYCWSKVLAKSTPVTIKHVWFVDDKKVFEFPLELKNPSSRVWSTKSIKVGKWKVEVTDEAGAVLSSIEFAVK